MESAVEVDGHSLDRVSQLLLLELDAAEGGARATGELADAVGATNQQVLYRMDTHILPAGLVAEAEPERDARRFELTDEGDRVVDDRRDALEAPRTVEEACQVANDARADVEALRNRVREVEEAIDGAEGRFDAVEEEVAAAADAVDELEGTAEELQSRVTTLEEDHARVRSGAKDIYEESRRSAALRDAGFVGRLRWLLTGHLPDP